ncbi:MAG: alpha/beta fold hydrolase, partial [Proteobacteria bacterium]|nr:alpha/beta fold hydrolase [Pseudomonadota bacterium]
MPGISANGTLIEYEAFGDPAAPPILLIMGLGAQMINWDAEFCRQLADRGLYVVRFDNRDVGMSQKFEEGGTPAVNQIMAAALRGEPFETPYTLDDMAADAVGLMDALGMDKAIICGASMGGMIAQVVALNYPERVLALV